jgi:hypothetical protein
VQERKYVIFENPDTGREYAVIFDRDIAHKSVADGVMRETARAEWGPKMFLEPVAAGFVGDAKRGSESLKLGPRPQDHAVLNGERPIVTPQPMRNVPPKAKLSGWERAKAARSR